MPGTTTPSGPQTPQQPVAVQAPAPKQLPQSTPNPVAAEAKTNQEAAAAPTAVRPVIDAGYPVLGRHPTQPRLAYFNGLGSKGSLLAPFYAGQLADAILGRGDPPRHLSPHRFGGPQPGQPPLP